LPADEAQLLCLKDLLETYASSTGLKVNFSKSSMIPINMSSERATLLALAIGCAIGAMPFTYLGLPMGTTRPTVEEYFPLLNKIGRKMMGFNKLLSYDGCLILVNSVLSALPTYYLCTFKLSPAIIEQIDKYRKHLLWDKGDINRRGGCLVKWEKA
jgi:hypothetical protein